ncbi:hypothetical protein ACIQBJ_13800 [Kitasatospora sp. NPDC088391]|uniref:hypothetical protein n=1 Tax=Kitasatospora sp. NPDC088391 TaxID=3364074 RepID=UPI003826AFD5
MSHGFAIGGDVAGNVIFQQVLGFEEKIEAPRFREGPYPVEEVTERLHAFVEPPGYDQMRKKLVSRQLLLLVGEPRTGTGTTALALLDDVTGGAQIMGVDPETDLTSWVPSASTGYLVQGLTPDMCARLDEVALNRLRAALEAQQAHLLVVVNRSTGLPRAPADWREDYLPPDPLHIAHARLEQMTRDGLMDPEQLLTGRSMLAEPPFIDYLAAAHSPAAGVEAAAELWEVVTNGRRRETAAENLRTNSAETVVHVLAAAAGSADDLALAATVALLEQQDRSVVEHCAAQLRDRLRARAGSEGVSTPRANLLGRSTEERLKAVQVRLLPRSVSLAGGLRHWSQPVAFRGKHLAEEVLRQLWLDYEGFSELLLEWLFTLPHAPGIERVAGRRIGQVLCHASGSKVLRPLNRFADSQTRWHRQLVGHALGEAIEDTVLSQSVRTRLRQWSQNASVPNRCTVAETCAGSVGLALPAFALSLLHNVLAIAPLDEQVRRSVSGALAALLTESANRAPVLEQLTAWLAAPLDTARHAFAAHAVEALCHGGFPATARAGSRLTLAGLLADGTESLVPLALAALDDPTLHETIHTALVEMQRSGPEGHERAYRFVTALATATSGHPGLQRFMLSAYRHLPQVLAPAVVR